MNNDEFAASVEAAVEEYRHRQTSTWRREHREIGEPCQCHNRSMDLGHFASVEHVASLYNIANWPFDIALRAREYGIIDGHEIVEAVESIQRKWRKEHSTWRTPIQLEEEAQILKRIANRHMAA
jgi:hypothetical protein